MTTATGSYATAALLKTQAGISDTADDTLLGYICDRVNQYIERKTGRVLAPIGSATYYYDGDGSTSLDLSQPASGEIIGGIRAITTLELAYYTGGSYGTVPASNYFLRQTVGPTGPFERLEFTNYPTGLYSNFPVGYNTVKLTGTAGWAAIPDDITDVALTAATRAWFARESGQVDIVGSSETGAPVVSRFFSARDLETLRAYTIVGNLV